MALSGTSFGTPADGPHSRSPRSGTRCAKPANGSVHSPPIEPVLRERNGVTSFKQMTCSMYGKRRPTARDRHFSGRSAARRREGGRTLVPVVSWLRLRVKALVAQVAHELSECGWWSTSIARQHRRPHNDAPPASRACGRHAELPKIHHNNYAPFAQTARPRNQKNGPIPCWNIGGRLRLQVFRKNSPAQIAGQSEEQDALDGRRSTVGIPRLVVIIMGTRSVGRPAFQFLLRRLKRYSARTSVSPSCRSTGSPVRVVLRSTAKGRFLDRSAIPSSSSGRARREQFARGHGALRDRVASSMR